MEHKQFPIDCERLRSLLHRTIDIYSPSGKERDLLEFLQGYLKKKGIPVQRQAVDEQRFNLLVLPSHSEPSLVMVSHVDTVSAWDLDRFAHKEEKGIIQGLGAADMKSGMAAMIEAFIHFYETQKTLPPVALALVVGEEENGDGAHRLIQEHHFPWAIIGEPTDLSPCLSHYGYIEVQLRTQGRRRHASLSKHNENAAQIMLNALIEVINHLEEHHSGVVYNIRDLFSARTGFVVPDRCEAWIDLHLPPLTPIGKISAELEEIFVPFNQNGYRTITIDAGYDIPEKGPAVECLQKILKDFGRPFSSQAFRSHSDANQIWAAGIKPILLGPGRLEEAHTPEESVDFSKVCKAAEVYSAILTAAAEDRWH